MPDCKTLPDVILVLVDLVECRSTLNCLAGAVLALADLAELAVALFDLAVLVEEMDLVDLPPYSLCFVLSLFFCAQCIFRFKIINVIG